MFIYLLAILSVLVYLILKYKHSYWTRRQILQVEPRFILGSVDKRIFKSGSPTQFVREAYLNLKKKGVQHGGMYLFYTPIWIPIDLNLIKQILVTDYDSFSSHGFYHNKNDILSENIFTKEGEEWKTLRSNLSPTFTPAKLKAMYDILYNFGHQLEAQIADTCSKRQAINIRDITASYLTDVIAACFFGIEANRIKETKREFQHYGHLITQPRPFRQLLESILSWDLLVSLGYNFFPRKVTHFFIKLIKGAIDAKERNNLKTRIRKDYLDIVMQLMKDGGPLSFEEVVANSTFMYVAGYETSTCAVSHLMFELAKNQDVQNKLRSEILSISNNNAKGEITYEDLCKMKYADMCITEILRCYPALPQLSRACTKEYRIPGTDQIIEKGTLTLIPIWAIQNDPDCFPNPTKFDPENMSSENKNSKIEDTWFGFGYGPRLCLGYKFAAMQIKIALLNYLRNYKYTLNDKTPGNLTFGYDTILLCAVEDIILDIEPLE
nr:cytochrome P450 CYP6DH3 [Dendroctonus rhizophagus]